jgi:uncharacterized protein (TIGR02186 family)
MSPFRLPLLLLAACAAAALAWSPARAQGGAFQNNDPTVAAALTDDLISITSRFTGATIDVFGVVNGLGEGDDVVVVVRGPRPLVRLLRKRRVIGIWLNGEPVELEGAPAYYATASTRPLADIASRRELARNDIGFEHVPLRPVGDNAEEVELRLEEYRTAIKRIKERDQLFRDMPGQVDVYEAGLFRARIELPPGSPTGTYRADVFVFRDGITAARRSAELQVVKVGLERFIYTAAHERPFLYGLSAVAFASFAGWLAGAVWRRR